ncbi:MAG: nitrogenase iron protein [Geobacteraceae bacterium]
MSTHHIAIYGRGGAGTSAVTSNISAALAGEGYRVIQIGCDPQNDSTSVLRDGRELPSVLDVLKSNCYARLEDVSQKGFNGVLCIEAMSLFQSGDCAGRGISEVFHYFEKTGIIEEYKPDIVLYDLPLEVLCGVFSFPSSHIRFDRAYVVSTQDFPSLFTTNTILRILAKNAPSGGAKLGGIIAHGLTGPFSESIVRDFAKRTGVRAVSYLPHSTVVIQSELYGQTVLEAAPMSNHAYIFRRLAKQVIENRIGIIPTPFDAEALRSWAREWGDRIFELEAGFINPGAAI